MERLEKSLTLIIICFVIFSIFSAFQTIKVCTAEEVTIYVDKDGSKDYITIQAAIDAANESDTVYVYSGNYNENIVIDKTLTLTGENKENTFVTGVSENDITLKIQGNFLEYVSNVVVSGFQILQNPTAISNEYACLYTEYAQYCTITDCIIKNSYNGIRMKQTDESIISENTIENNDGDGILLFVNSDKNEIKNNLIQNNNRGIYLQDLCTENTISSNNIFSNTNYGINIIGSSDNNILYHNDFENSNNAYDESSNTWHYNFEGNYWNDYTGSDSDEDGIGDTPYSIAGGSNQDLYPLGDFLGTNQPPSATIDSITPNPAIEGQTINFNGHGSDSDGSITAWEWYVAETKVSSSEDYSSSSYTLGTYNVKYRVKDNGGTWSSFASDTFTVSSDDELNNEPVVYLLSPKDSTTVFYGESIQFSGVGQDPDEGDTISFSWTSNKDGAISTESQFYKSDLSINTHTITFRVTDNHGKYSEESITLNVIKDPNIENNPPVADTGGPYTNIKNNTIAFDGSNSYDSDDGDSIIDYSWDFGDGTTASGIIVEHTYTDDGDYLVQLTVTDTQGEQSIDSTNIIISSKSDYNEKNKNNVPILELILIIVSIGIIGIVVKIKKN